MPEAKIRSHFPDIYSKSLALGVDITKDLIPVVPAAHYFCGGVWVDDVGRTSIRNLYAIGEVSCTGLHGANRLASTSLLEGLVWGTRSAVDVEATLGELRVEPGDIPAWKDAGLTEVADPALISQDMSSIKNIMWNYVGLARTSDRLARAMRELRNLEFEIDRFYRVTKLSDSLIRLTKCSAIRPDRRRICLEK